MIHAKDHVHGAAVPIFKELITYLTIEVIATVPKISERIAYMMSTKIRVRLFAGTISPLYEYNVGFILWYTCSSHDI